MIQYTCDRDGCSVVGYGEAGEMPIYLKGYHPKNSAGILLPERWKEKHFCSHDCFVDFMKWALGKEPYYPSEDDE